MQDGSIDRTKLGNLIFTNEEARRKLNKATHSEVLKETLKEIFWNFIKGTSLVILDSPLLFETKSDKFMSNTIVIWVNNEIQLKRLQKRDNISHEMAQNKILSQLSLDQKRNLAGIVIDNCGSLDDLKFQVDKCIKRIQPTLTYRILYQGIRISLLFVIPTIILYKLINY